ncbi:helix-turn-helix transcriptional regulator, partial [Pseudanabaenaceae cyanobacterium LEGE 13415]|nr:helix-turn-helix transcriptional regulator [Pseudanabaenaceae cyanobacterium LEGE 13415]
MTTLSPLNPLLSTVLEGFMDGILIVSLRGSIVYANTCAIDICRQLSASQQEMPKEVWRVCEALIESRELYGDYPLIIESEVTTRSAQSFRLRVQWLQFNEQSCLLVRLENQQQALKSLVHSETYQYGLTAREAEVWLLRRHNLSRREIAESLCITIDTVKKHLGNIRSK